MQFKVRRGCMAAVALILGSCGSDEAPPGVIAVVPKQAPAPSPAPSPTSAPTPTPTPAPVTTIEPYALGSMTYTLAPDIPADKVAAIRDSMDFAIAHTNTIAAFTGNVPVVFGANTPTAEAGFLGQIRFGGSIGRRVALHELAHWLGSGSVREWGGRLAGGRFTGLLATARMKAFDGPGAVLNADQTHFWPYGLNFDTEFSETQRNTQMVSAQFADMGLGPDAAAAITGTRRFQNRSSQFVLQGAATGGTAVETENRAGPIQQWRVDFADGFITIRNVESGLAIESSGAKGDNVPTMMSTSSTAASQQWEMLPVGEAGWFLLRNRATGNCLDNVGNLAAGARLVLWGCGFHPNQQWRLIR